MFNKIILIFWITLFVQSIFARAWVQESGKGLSISTLKHYVSTHFFNGNGELSSSPRFAKYEVDQYFEFGVSSEKLVN